MNYANYLKQTGEYGITEQIKYPIALLSGLPGASPNELIMFESGQTGQVISLERDLVEVLLFSSDVVKIGSQAARTGKQLSIGVGEDLLGSVINPLGEKLFSDNHPIKTKEEVLVYSSPRGIPDRVKLTNPFITGVALVDTLLPLGKGQRELIVGDRKTGKTSFILTTTKTQVESGSIVVYAAIGKKRTEVKKIKSFFENEGISKKIVMVAAVSDDSPSMIHLVPHTAMSIAEYFCQLGNDVLVVFDDLSTHAKFYREIALVGKKFPGRESYPGDMFYTHAKLLERAGNFKHPEKKEVSITALPVAETTEGDLTGYIVSNLISITDGHVLFSNLILNSGRKPAIDIFLSVTRVGRQTRKVLERELSTQVIAFLSRFEKLENLSHFGAELSEETKKILATGKQLLALFDQHYKLAIPTEVQLIMVMMIWQGLIMSEGNDQMVILRDNLVKKYKEDQQVQKLLNSIVELGSLEEALKLLTIKKEELLNLCKQTRI